MLNARVNAQQVNGTGLSLNSVTGISLPLIGSLGDVTIDQAVVTNFTLVENIVGQIVGLQADGDERRTQRSPANQSIDLRSRSL